MPFRVTPFLCLGFNKFTVVVTIGDFQISRLTEDLLQFMHTHALLPCQQILIEPPLCARPRSRYWENIIKQ